MTLGFPYSVETFADVIRMSSVRMRLVADQQISGMGGGRLVVADMSPKYWEFEVTLINMENALAKRVQGLIEALDESINDFYLYDPRAAYPSSDPTGAILTAGTAISLNGEAGFGSVAAGIYRVEGNAVTLAQSLSVVGDAGHYFDGYGVLQLSMQNVARIDYGPFANMVPNPKAAGATVGTPGGLPTGWSLFKDAGLSVQIVQAGITDGGTGVRMRFWGTPVATGDILMRFENGSIAAAAGPTIAALSVKLAAGSSLANVGVARIVCEEYTSGNAYVGGSTGGVVTFGAAWSRFSSASFTAIGAAGNYIREFLRIGITAGQPIDLTIDIDFPTLERAATASVYPRSPLAILAEPATANKLVRSREFDNASWTKTRASVTANVASILDPWGTAFADKLVEDSTAANSHQIYFNYTTTNYVNHVAYVLAKAGERTKFKMELSNFSTAACSAVFDLVAGTVSGVAPGVGDFIGASASITALGNGWYWCELEALKTPGDNDCVLGIYLCDAAGSSTYNGTGTSGIYLAHAQIEEGTVGRMPIVSTTVAVSRAADQLTFKAMGVNDFQLTFDDNTTQTVASVSGNWSPAASSLNRSRIKGWTASRRGQPVAEAVQIAELAANNKEIRLKKLPSGFRLKGGEMLCFDFGSPAKRAFHRMVTDGQAGGDGATDLIEVRPHILPGAAVDAVVTLIKPAARVKMIPGSFDPGTARQTMTTGMSFKCRQVLA